MYEYTAIADVGTTLIELLGEQMPDIKDSIMLISPGEIETTDNVLLSMFLYQINENVYMKNQNVRMSESTQWQKYPPLQLDLYYILTSHPSGIPDKTERTKQQHSILGRAMQVLYDNSIMKGELLKGTLNQNEEDELHITICPLNLDDITKIWTTFQDKTYKTSVCYLVTPVRIDSYQEKKTIRVTSKKLEQSYMVPKGVNM
jgi:hypothetical protein